MIAYSKTQYLWPFLLWHKKRPPNQANLSSRNILFFLKHFHRTGGNIFRNPILPFQQKAACGNTVPRKRRHWPDFSISHRNGKCKSFLIFVRQKIGQSFPVRFQSACRGTRLLPGVKGKERHAMHVSLFGASAHFRTCRLWG